MYSLPPQYWDEESLKAIGNGLGEFINITEEINLKKYTLYARICVYMHMENALSDSVSLYHDDFEWIQTIDYEHVPFRSRKFHAHGHLFQDCPLNQLSKNIATMEHTNVEGFTKVPSRKKKEKKPPFAPKKPPNASSAPSTSNNFEILVEKTQPASDPSQQPETSPKPSTYEPSASPLIPQTASKAPQEPSRSTPSLNKDLYLVIWQPNLMEIDGLLQDNTPTSGSVPEESQSSHMEEEPESIDIGDLDILGLEQACKQEAYDKIPHRQIDNLEVILFSAHQQRSLGIQLGSHWDGKKIFKETKKRGRRTDLQRTIIIGEMLVESGRYPKLTKFYLPISNGSQ